MWCPEEPWAGNLGRNHPCPCGSGKKYKVCCMRTQPRVVPPDVLREFARRNRQKLAAEKQRVATYGHTPPIIHTDVDGKRLVAVGNRLFRSDRWRTYPDFLYFHIRHVLGESWWDAELRNPPRARHRIINWYEKAMALNHAQPKPQDGIVGLVPSGPYAAFINLAYDLCVLKGSSSVPQHLINRLRHPEQFQGARYEIFVAATCVRAGFRLTFEDEQDGSTKHAEFTAVHKSTDQPISVEAKSRHRPGVLGYPGRRQPDEDVRTRIGHLLHQAISVEPPHPLAIFVDLNISPQNAQRLRHDLPNRITKLLRNARLEKDDRQLYNLLVLTNHPHHYGRDDEPDPHHDFIGLPAMHPKDQADHPEVFEILYDALLKYGRIPNWFPDD